MLNVVCILVGGCVVLSFVVLTISCFVFPLIDFLLVQSVCISSLSLCVLCLSYDIVLQLVFISVLSGVHRQFLHFVTLFDSCMIAGNHVCLCPCSGY